MMARQRDAIAEDSLRKLTEIDPRKSAHHYNLGLSYKTRGRFAEGVAPTGPLQVSRKKLSTVVTGRIAAPPDIAPARLLDLIDKGIEKRGTCQLYAPDLCAAAGQLARERIDRRRFALLTDN
jgi:hypothetical protein